MKIPWASLALCVALVSAYFYFGAEPYAPSSAVAAFGLSSWNLGGVLTSPFVHQGMRHLLSNLLPIAAFSIFLEASLGVGAPFLVLLIFFASSMIAGLAYILLDSGAIVIGASAGGAGLMSAAFALKPKQGIALALLIVALVLLFVGPGTDVFAESRAAQITRDLTSFAAQSHEAQSAVVSAGAVLSQTRSRIAALEEQNDTAAAQSERAALGRLQAEFADAAAREAAARAELAQAQGKAADFATGAEQEKAPASALPHAIGALVGIALILVFRRGAVDENIRGFKKWLSRGNRNTRKVRTIRRVRKVSR